jgi:MFS family permease
MDHAGAIIGPLLATAILFFAPENYRLVFGLTIIPGALAVWALTLVPEKAQLADVDGSGDADDRGAALHGPPNVPASTKLPGRLWAFLGILLVFSLGNSADAFLLLRLSEALGSATYVPLLWSGIHVVKASLSTWSGGLSDRLGRKKVIIVGWVIYAVVYLGFASTPGARGLIAWFLLYGTYFGFFEGAGKALVADLTPQGKQGLAFGYYNAALGVGALIASVAFGFLYERFGPAVAFGTGSALAGLAALLLLMLPADAKMVDSNA